LAALAEEHLPRYVVLGAADLIQQVVRLVGRLECVRHDEQEAAGERPSEVRAPTWVDVEAAGELPQRPGRLVRSIQPAVVQAGGEQQDEEPAYDARARNMASWLPVNSLTRKVPVTEARRAAR
jgi:hypothetical protein